MDAQASFRYPGIRGITDATFTFTTGIDPCVCVLTCVPQVTNPSPIGPLTLIYGGTTIVFQDCAVDQGTAQYNEQGQLLSVRILDRRWRWRDGEITGRYNHYQDDREILDGTERTPHELATLLLQAMGETGFSVGGLPNSTRPEVVWSSANPAQELYNLCESLGCRIVLGLDNRVYIQKKGQPSSIPQRGSGVVASSLSIDPAELPSALKAVFKQNRFQFRWDTEAVGRETDGTLKPIDDLSYKPADGWEKESVKTFPNVLAEHGTKAHKLAKESVFRLYRITEPTGGVTIQGPSGTITPSKALCLPLESTRLEVDTDESTGLKSPRKAALYGTYWDGKGNHTNVDDVPLDISFGLDTQLGVVTLSEPTVKLNDDTENEPADLQLEVACSVRASPSQPFGRNWFTLPVSGGRGLTRIFNVEELEAQFIWTYSGTSATGPTHNVSEINRAAEQFLISQQQILATLSGFTVSYEGFKAVWCSGSVLQVSWNYSSEGGFTHISVNSELDRIVRDEQKKRLDNAMRRALDMLQVELITAKKKLGKAMPVDG